jgi:hypothetical protein
MSRSLRTHSLLVQPIQPQARCRGRLLRPRADLVDRVERMAKDSIYVTLVSFLAVSSRLPSSAAMYTSCALTDVRTYRVGHDKRRLRVTAAGQSGSHVEDRDSNYNKDEDGCKERQRADDVVSRRQGQQRKRQTACMMRRDAEPGHGGDAWHAVAA